MGRTERPCTSGAKCQDALALPDGIDIIEDAEHDVRRPGRRCRRPRPGRIGLDHRSAESWRRAVTHCSPCPHRTSTEPPPNLVGCARTLRTVSASAATSIPNLCADAETGSAVIATPRDPLVMIVGMTNTYHRIMAVTTGQLGLLSRRQANGVGMSNAQLRSRVSSGSLLQVGVDTYRLPGAPTGALADLHALMLDIGGEVWASGPTAAALHEFRRLPPPSAIRRHDCAGTRRSADRTSIALPRSWN